MISRERYVKKSVLRRLLRYSIDMILIRVTPLLLWLHFYSNPMYCSITLFLDSKFRPDRLSLKLQQRGWYRQIPIINDFDNTDTKNPSGSLDWLNCVCTFVLYCRLYSVASWFYLFRLQIAIFIYLRSEWNICGTGIENIGTNLSTCVPDPFKVVLPFSDRHRVSIFFRCPLPILFSPLFFVQLSRHSRATPFHFLFSL